MGYLSIILLSTVGALCAIGVFHPLYKDTLGERVGMSLIALWCLARVGSKLTNPDTEPVNLLLHTGMFVFAVSMASAKWKARHVIRSRSMYG